MVPLFIVWVLVRVRILFISSLGSDFIYLESGSGFYRCSPGPDCISDESGSRSRSGFYPLRVRILYWSGSGLYPFLSRVRVRNLSSKSGSMSVSSFVCWSGFYQACPGSGPRPDSTNTRPGSHLGHVWII